MAWRDDVDPHSGLLRKPPLPRSAGERNRTAATPAPLQPGFLSPAERGRGAEQSEAEWGSTPPYAIPLPLWGGVRGGVLQAKHRPLVQKAPTFRTPKALIPLEFAYETSPHRHVPMRGFVGEKPGAGNHAGAGDLNAFSFRLVDK